MLRSRMIGNGDTFSTLASSYRLFQFYTDFQNVLTKFRDNCKDYAFSRNVDKKDYLAQLQQSITNVPALPPRNNAGYPNASPAAGPQPGYPGMPPPGTSRYL